MTTTKAFSVRAAGRVSITQRVRRAEMTAAVLGKCRLVISKVSQSVFSSSYFRDLTAGNKAMEGNEVLMALNEGTDDTWNVAASLLWSQPAQALRLKERSCHSGSASCVPQGLRCLHFPRRSTLSCSLCPSPLI